MVNGTLSRILYIGALSLVGIWLIGVFVLLSFARDIPVLLWGFPAPLVTFIFGTHVKPPISTDANGSMLYSDQRAA